MCRTWEGVPLYLRLGNRRGLIWKALVIWKHQVAETAARHATERRKTTRWHFQMVHLPQICTFRVQQVKRELKLRAGGKNNMLTNRRFNASGEKKGKASAARDKRPVLTWKIRNNELQETWFGWTDLGPILGKDSSRKDLFNPSTMSEIYLPKPKQVCRRGRHFYTPESIWYLSNCYLSMGWKSSYCSS